MSPLSGNKRTLYQYFSDVENGGIRSGLVANNNRSFTLNGKEITILGGSLHYFRVHPMYWGDRLAKMRAAGLNSVDVYDSQSVKLYVTSRSFLGMTKCILINYNFLFQLRSLEFAWAHWGSIWLWEWQQRVLQVSGYQTLFATVSRTRFVCRSSSRSLHLRRVWVRRPSKAS